MSEYFPDFVRALRGENHCDLFGPAVGPSLQTTAREHDAFSCEMLAGLWYCLNNVVSFPLADGLAPGIPYQATLMPGQVGFKAIDPYKLPPPMSFKRGPEPGCADLVIISKHPGELDEQNGWLFSDEHGVELVTAAQEAGVPDDMLTKAYVTNVCRFVPPPGGKFKRSWVNECMWMLWAELAIIQPKLVLLLGGDVIKTFHGTKASVQRNRGVVTPYTLNLGDGQSIEVPTFCTIHPSASLRDPTMRGGLSSDLVRANSVLTGVARRTRERNYSVERSVLTTLDAIRKYVDARVAANDLKFAIDCEWDGSSPWNDGRLRTLQLSHGVGEAALIPFRCHPVTTLPPGAQFEQITGTSLITFKSDLGMEFAVMSDGAEIPGELLAHAQLDSAGNVDITKPVEVLNRLQLAWTPAEQSEIVQLLNTLLQRPGVRVGGHNFRADYPWLERLGVPLREQYRTGFDTMLKHHLLCESGDQDLNALITKYTDMDRYDQPINEFLSSGIRPFIRDGHGFGLIPDHLLYPYALHDAAVTFWIDEALDKEYEDNSREDRTQLKALLQSEMDASIGILEIERGGLTVDVERIRSLATKYATKRGVLETELRDTIAWQSFNFRSVQHVRELLFGAELNGRAWVNGVPDQLRPDGAYCCNLTPIKTTSKPPKDWSAVVSEGEERIHSASTDKESLGILADRDEVAEQLRRLRFVDQVCKGFTAEPLVDADGETTERGLMAYVDPDHRIRTHIFQSTETGRWASSKPNLQNIPSRREPMLHSLFDKNDKPSKIRTVFMAEPGNVLIEADYAQAELVVLALLSGDLKFWAALMDAPTYNVLHVPGAKSVKYWLHHEATRNTPKLTVGEIIPAGAVLGDYRDSSGNWVPLRLTEDMRVAAKQWKRDLHAERGISGFRIPYSPVLDGPPKSFIESVGKDKRIAAKTVNFGIPYGRAAPAIARELRQDGVKIDVKETQAIVDGWHEEYQLASQFLDKCKWCVANLGYLVTPFGRRRRFAKFEDPKMMAKQQREGCNFPIQSTVADCLNKAVANVWADRERIAKLGRQLNFRLALGIHDALLFVCQIDTIPFLMEKGAFIDHCMSDKARVPLPRDYMNDCGGLYRNIDPGKFPYAIEVDKSVDLRWTSKPDNKKEPEAYKAWRSELLALGVPARYCGSED